jgi:glycosyltransferase involved in cell wall biosynthesis
LRGNAHELSLTLSGSLPAVSVSISILILTLDEELNLPACLASLTWSDDIVVLDSYSSDRTVEIARRTGARVYQRRFDNERNQRTFGLREIPFKYPWVYIPDADEITPPELRDEMLSIVAAPERPEVAFRIRRKDFFMGRWLRYSSLYPTWFVRLVRPEAVCFQREINLRVVANGQVGILESHIVHYSFNKGLESWYDKQNRYTSLEALEALQVLKNGSVDWHGLFSLHDPVRRRAALKDLSFRLPLSLRPSCRFVYMYIVRRGCLDGWAGYTYCRLLAACEYMIVVKLRELHRRNQGQPI